MALGGSTNTVLHLMAIAHEAGISLDLKLFDKISKSTPHITSLEPAGTHFMEDLEYAGGIPAVLKRLKNKLNNTLTLSGKRIFDITKTADTWVGAYGVDLGVKYTRYNSHSLEYDNLSVPKSAFNTYQIFATVFVKWNLFY